MIGVWWVGRWGSPTPLHRSDVYHRTHYATLLSSFWGFLLEHSPFCVLSNFCSGLLDVPQWPVRKWWKCRNLWPQATFSRSHKQTQTTGQPITWQEHSALGRTDVMKASEVQSKILNVKEFPLFFWWKSWRTWRAKSCDERSTQQCSFFSTSWQDQASSLSAASERKL